jgi:quinoprotein glucose dehydrogenase
MSLPRHYLPAALLAAVLPASGDDIETPKRNDDRYPVGSPSQQTAEAALKGFSVAPGLQVQVWASEPLLENPVAFTFDEQGRAYVAETHRRRTSVPDIRKYEAWTIENLALRSVDERVALIKSKFPADVRTAPTKDRADQNKDGQFDWRDLEIESEKVRVLEDSNHDGKADRSRVLAESFNSLATGVGAGVAIHNGEAFFTCIPDLWKIKSDGSKEKLFSGFGVHVAYSGHDMHGVKIGMDGRLYWSIADCGAHVVDKNGNVLIDVPDSGAVFRCNPDGTNLELVAKGLRNPQSLAFNEFGDLFTGDNNADGGDKARWTHVVKGADYGWRIGWQFLPKLGAWNSEGMWHLDTAERNSAILPPAGHVGHGPAGIAYYPGTGLPEAYRDHFFYADFPGGIRSFRLAPKGSSYTVQNPGDILMDNSPQKMTGKVLWNLYPSDVAFAPGGGLYVLDWVQGWEKTGKGRIFRIFDPAIDASEPVKDTMRLLNEGFAKRSDGELAKLLGHVDQRVRLASQFELLKRGKIETLKRAAEENSDRIARLHALWGLDQIARASKPSDSTIVNLLSKLTGDPDDEVRAQATKVLLNHWPIGKDSIWLSKLLRDPSPRVRFFACGFFCKPGDAPNGLFETLAEIASQTKDDPFLQFAAVRALETISPSDQEITELPANVAVRMLDRLPTQRIAQLLSGRDASAALNAARRIHDGDFRKAWPSLATMANTAGLSAPFWSRAVNTCYLLGTTETAELLARAATNARLSPEQRTFALESLAIWNAPLGRDRITGLWRDIPPRSESKGAREVAAQIVPVLLADANESVRLAAANLAGATSAKATDSALLSAVSDPKAGGEVRAGALRALAAMNSPKLIEAEKIALADSNKPLLEAARKLAAKASPADAIKVNREVLGKGSIREQQEAIATISQQPGEEADRAIAEQFERLVSGTLPKALSLDLLEAAARRTSPEVKSKLAAWVQSRNGNDPLTNWRECLEGGDAKIGREIFFEKAEAACLRCHKVKGEGGDVGPDLAGIGGKQNRDYILRSIVDPNAAISPGFENVVVTLTDGNIAAGILSAEDAATVTLKSLADGTPQKIEKAKIKERTAVPSAMPPGLGDVLGKRGLRDVVEFLATLK